MSTHETEFYKLHLGTKTTRETGLWKYQFFGDQGQHIIVLYEDISINHVRFRSLQKRKSNKSEAEKSHPLA